MNKQRNGINLSLGRKAPVPHITKIEPKILYKWKYSRTDIFAVSCITVYFMGC